jgi:hypothetical protein
MALADTGKAIGKVTGLLKEWLNVKTGLIVDVGRPEPANGSTEKRLNLFLYEAGFDPSLKNVSLAEGQPPPLWLVLKYLLTAFEGVDSDSAEAHLNLGEGIRALQQLSFLPLTGIEFSDPEILAALADNPEPLKITFNETSSDLLSRLMQGSDEKYRFSMAFEVRPVMIATGEPPSHSLLVGIDYTRGGGVVIEEKEKGVHIPVLPSLGPEITGVSPLKFEAGDTVILYGNNLGMSGLSVRLDQMELGVTAQRPNKLECKVNDNINDGKVMSAGSYPLQVVQKLPAGRCRSSNLLVGNLIPILVDAVPSIISDNPVVVGTIELNGTLLGTYKDIIMVALYQDGKVVKSFEIVLESPEEPTLPTDPIQTQLILNIAADDEVIPGTYRVILLVNGQQAKNSPQVELTVP